MTTSLSIAEILLFIKRWGKFPSQTLPNNARVNRNAYLRPTILTSAHCASAVT